MTDTPERWVKIPSAGQFRGEGTWTRVENTNYVWETVKDGRFLPVFEGPYEEIPHNLD